MHHTEIIRKSYVRQFLFMLLLILVLGTALSATVLYYNVHRPLNTHYSAVLTIITGLKETLILKTFKIHAVSFLLIAAGIGILTLLYTHRIAGPLHRIKLYARTVTEGKLNDAIAFRRKDAITDFAESLNTMTNKYRSKVTSLVTEVGRLEAHLQELRDAAGKEKAPEDTIARIAPINTAIRALMKDLKL